MLMSIFSRRSGGGGGGGGGGGLFFSLKAVLAFAACLITLLSSPRGAVADPPVDPRCRVFCFRITDIRCDTPEPNRYHIEFEVLNWSDAFAGGIKLQLSTFSDVGVQFGNGYTDPDGRPIIETDLLGQGHPSNFEDANGNGILDPGEDFNGNSRLDNDPIPGNLDRTTEWTLDSATPTTLEWKIEPDAGAIPFINLVGARNCTKCIEGLPDRGGPQLVTIDANGNADPLEYVDNGDNVQDGFVMVLDGMEPGKVAHINWFLTGAGGNRTDPEDAPSGDCREGKPDVAVGEPIGTMLGGNAYGFGLISLYRQMDDDDEDDLPGGSFQGQTGFAQTPTEFFDGVHNAIPFPNNPNQENCGKFGMEFTPGTTCEAADLARESSCPPGMQAIPGQGSGVMPVINGKIEPGEWDGATVIPLWQASKDDGSKPTLSTAWVKVNCVTNKWYVRTEINREEGTTHMMDLPEDQFVKLGITGQLGGALVDGNSDEKDGQHAHFRWVYGKNDKGEKVKIGWEACFKWTESEQANFMKIHTQVWTNFTDPGEVDGETSATPGTNPNNMFEVCVCGGSLWGAPNDTCKPIDTSCGGDPHFSTWSGEKFTFHGECDLVLIRNPTFADGVGMHVHGRTKIHEGWSDMESVAIRIGDDVFEARGSREYWINGELNARLPALVGGYQVSLQQLNARRNRLAYVVHLGGEKELRIKTFDKMMWVQIKGQQARDFAGSDGLFGHYGNGNMVARDGATVINVANDYGQEWQVRPDLGDPALFRTLEGRQYPQKCKMPVRSNLRSSNNGNNKMKDLMDNEGVLRAIAKKACAHAPKQEMDDCIYDVVATHNVEVAEAY